MTATDGQSGPSLKILVVEDYPDTADSMAKLLELYGHQARIAPDGPSAIEACKQFWPDVILLDIGLPGMDGYAVAKTIREHCSHGDKMPLMIAVSGYATQADIVRSRAEGINFHFAKPVDPEVLKTLLEPFMDLSSGQR